MKEAAKTSIISHEWKEFWAYYAGIFNFENSRTKEEFCSTSDPAAPISQDTSDFVNWVTHVVEQHHGATIEEFKVAFPLDNAYQAHIDKWVVFALAKGAKSLELDFNVRPAISMYQCYTLPLQCCKPLKGSYNLASAKPGLRTLVLNSIIIGREVLECFLYSCLFLENLHIRCAPGLTSISVSGLPLALKHLDVSDCLNLENIDLLAPKLLTFRYQGQPIQLHIQNASLLSEVSVCGRRGDPEAPISQDTYDFVNWMTHVVEQHRGATIEEFKVAFPLDKTYQSHIDKWVVFALAKGARSLELDFNARPAISIYHSYTLPLQCCKPLRGSYNLASSKPGLRTLVLNSIIIGREVLECFLYSCLFLENLHICCAPGLTSISVSGLPLALKHLDVSDCCSLENIDISAPKLLTFRYQGQPIQLCIQNASLLSEVSICGRRVDPIAYAFDSLSECFSTLEYLHVTTSLLEEMNLVIPPVPNLTNLKHLKLSIQARCGQTLLGWITLIQASPVLQKLTLEFASHSLPCEMRLRKHGNPQPLKCLKSLELFGFVGRLIDLEMAAYVFENAAVLEEVVVGFKSYIHERRLCPVHILEVRLMDLKQKLPAGATLIINNYDE